MLFLRHVELMQLKPEGGSGIRKAQLFDLDDVTAHRRHRSRSQPVLYTLGEQWVEKTTACISTRWLGFEEGDSCSGYAAGFMTSYDGPEGRAVGIV